MLIQSKKLKSYIQKINIFILANKSIYIIFGQSFEN